MASVGIFGLKIMSYLSIIDLISEPDTLLYSGGTHAGVAMLSALAPHPPMKTVAIKLLAINRPIITLPSPE
jgi:hypothetical protein